MPRRPGRRDRHRSFGAGAITTPGAHHLAYNDRPMSGANIFVVVLFSLVGLAAFRYGRKSGETSPLVLGVLLMVYGYFTPNVWLSLLVGGLLTALIFYRQ
jgi:hypothetical protein